MFTPLAHIYKAELGRLSAKDEPLFDAQSPDDFAQEARFYALTHQPQTEDHPLTKTQGKAKSLTKNAIKRGAITTRLARQLLLHHIQQASDPDRAFKRQQLQKFFNSFYEQASQQDKELLELLKLGLNQESIAASLNLNQSTISRRIKSLKNKLISHHINQQEEQSC